MRYPKHTKHPLFPIPDAPTLKVALQRARQTIEVQKKEIESLKEKIVFLDEDRNYLRETLRDALAPKGDTTRSSVPDEQIPVARLKVRAESTAAAYPSSRNKDVAEEQAYPLNMSNALPMCKCSLACSLKLCKCLLTREKRGESQVT
ncbi:hypothetical protein MHYP_G00113500 [Metynnis hypsauchen]